MTEESHSIQNREQTRTRPRGDVLPVGAWWRPAIIGALALTLALSTLALIWLFAQALIVLALWGRAGTSTFAVRDMARALDLPHGSGHRGLLVLLSSAFEILLIVFVSLYWLLETPDSADESSTTLIRFATCAESGEMTSITRSMRYRVAYSCLGSIFQDIIRQG